jgi:glycosyltransferase involved in cell wall biosynthesis
VSTVSVVVPTYNRAELLQQTIQSILAQTVPALEVILVDDGSTDHTPEVCAGFGESIRYLRQENQGLSMARNTGIQAARGDWIAFCDSDDLWRPRKLEVQLAALDSTGAGWSVTDFGLIASDGRRFSGNHDSFSHAFALFEEIDVTPAKHFGRWLEARNVPVGTELVIMYAGDAFGMLFEGNFALPSTSMVARTLVNKVGAFDKTFRAEETEFFHRIAAYATVAIVMQQLADYRIGHPSLIKGDPVPFIEDAIRSLELAAVLRPTLTPREQAAFREGRRRLRMRLAYARLSSLDRAGARSALYDGLREDRILSPRSTAIMLASLLPDTALRSLYWAKRVIAGHRQ